jgi:hydroxyacylglutathione hydrolase
MLEIQAFTFNPVQENTYVLHNENREAIIIDPGCFFTAEEAELQRYITEKELTPTRILATHCHFDHVFGCRWAARTYGIELWLHPAEEPVLQHAPVSVQKFGLGFDPYTGPLHYLNEGDVVELGNERLEVLFTPGHSPGSISFYNRQHGFVVSGDVLFKQSIGRTDLPGGNMDTLVNSIRAQLYTLPDETVVYAGHGPSTTIGYEKAHNGYVQVG